MVEERQLTWLLSPNKYVAAIVWNFFILVLNKTKMGTSDVTYIYASSPPDCIQTLDLWMTTRRFRKQVWYGHAWYVDVTYVFRKWCIVGLTWFSEGLTIATLQTFMTGNNGLPSSSCSCVGNWTKKDMSLFQWIFLYIYVRDKLNPWSSGQYTTPM